jgi:hypothetical protein
MTTRKTAPARVFMTEVGALIEAVESSRRTLIDRIAGLTEAQAGFRPADGQWNVLEIVEHLYLAELSGVSKIWAALEGVRGGREWPEARPNASKPIEDIVAATWKPKEVAPPIATPHIFGPLSFWVASTRSLTPILAKLGSELEAVSLEAVVFPHYLCGPLDGRQRLEFLRYHIDRHLSQIDGVRTSPDYPS